MKILRNKKKSKIQNFNEPETDRILLETVTESKEWFKILFEYAPDGYYLNDLKGCIIGGNKAAEEIIGYKKEELIGKSFLRLDLITPTQIIKASKLLDLNALGKLTGPDEFIIKRKDGTFVSVEVMTHPVIIKNRTIVLVIMHDITKRKKGEDELKNAKKELEIKTKSLEETNTALKVLLEHQDITKKEMEKNILNSIKTLVIPYLEKIKIGASDERIKTYINIVELNISEITKPFTNQLVNYYIKLTPVEIQIASLIKDDKSTKDIAGLLNISENTLFFYRKNIRTKLGLKNKKINLRSYLKSL